MAAGSLHAVSRTATFGPALGLPAWGWMSLGQPLHWAGLGVLTAVALVIWPALAMTVLALNSSVLAGSLVPRRVRARYRERQRERGIPRERQRSSYISKRLRRVTYFADRYRCAGCGERGVRLQVDHVVAWAAGGLTVLWNTMSLCEPCNGIKSNYNRDRDGYEHYHGSRRDIYRARAILARERRHRYNPLRWTRAAWALGS
jgi:5-methylcytosine-specific restriction endonuclease McrA